MRADGRFDPMLPGLLLAAMASIVRRHRSDQK
ncbi:JDVT-CTERM domain-containing protein [Noviherbaspirillum saxi]|uniref:JDVT-CTERM domain-containing protein n=2 Tax=Noviherbaspirillum saxi TaxID=2320863 RepID=A0A3A3GD08_9BURK|nr:JDVT-CTERM domain-containing protein [Noviherbaspirillum saxi]